MDGSIIKKVEGRQIISHRGHPGIEATVTTVNGSVGRAVCTAGLSVGTFEIPFAYDGGTRWNGKGVTKAVNSVNEIIAPLLIGLDAANQAVADDILIALQDPENPKYAGGNATASVSAAVLKAGAAALSVPLYRHIGGTRATRLPVPGFLAFLGSCRYGGGARAFGKPSYSFISYDFGTFSEAEYALWEVVAEWKRYMGEKHNLHSLFDDRLMINAGYFDDDEQIWGLMAETIDRLGYGGKVGLQVDVAADSFYSKETGFYEGLFSAAPKSRRDMIDKIKYMVKNYPFVICEDPLNETDYDGHAALTGDLDIQIVGDDLFTTNTERVEIGIRKGAANCVLLKVNQVGTITQASEMIKLAFDNGYGVMPCNSRGEDVDICDYCVGFGTGTVRESGLLRFGNRFREIEAELGPRAQFAGKRGIKGSRFSLASEI